MYTESNIVFIFEALTVIFVVFLFKCIYLKCRRDPRLVKISSTLPGPAYLPLIGNGLSFCQTENSIKLLVDYAKIYGPTYRFWIGNYLVIGLSNIEDMEVVFGSSRMLSKPEFFNTYQDFWGNGLAVTDSATTWRKTRKLFQSIFYRNILNCYVPQFNQKVYKLVDKLMDHVSGPEFDIGPYLTKLSFDMLVKTTLNSELDWNDELPNRFRSSILKAAEIGFTRACFPCLQNQFIDKLFFKNQTKILRERAKQYLKKVIDEKKDEIQHEIELHKNKDSLSDEANIPPPKSLLTLAYELQESEGDEEVMYDELLNILTAGIDTSGITSAFFILAIAIHQDIQNKLYNELYDVFGDSDRMCDENDISRLPYLDQVLKETLRIFLINPILCRKVEVDSKIANRIIPAGTSILISVAAVHFNPEYYPNPWTFNPDNFSPEAVQKRHKLTFLPFSAGPRNCIATHFAMLEMKIAIIALLRNFSFHTTMKMEDIHYKNNALAMVSANGYNVAIKPRRK